MKVIIILYYGGSRRRIERWIDTDRVKRMRDGRLTSSEYPGMRISRAGSLRTTELHLLIIPTRVDKPLLRRRSARLQREPVNIRAQVLRRGGRSLSNVFYRFE
ncbi:uncharacterized protein LOC124411078 [Diprion similis]|uniref:uncharacterized protein LOC124411078 n=1 Tax=Diprion similis TaxID=362088 RepID=UPI001EF89382|nr:uncharacterized protein LOC124411078 [Diprion similis]